MAPQRLLFALAVLALHLGFSAAITCRAYYGAGKKTVDIADALVEKRDVSKAVWAGLLVRNGAVG